MGGPGSRRWGAGVVAPPRWGAGSGSARRGAGFLVFVLHSSLGFTVLAFVVVVALKSDCLSHQTGSQIREDESGSWAGLQARAFFLVTDYFPVGPLEDGLRRLSQEQSSRRGPRERRSPGLPQLSQGRAEPRRRPQGLGRSVCARDLCTDEVLSSWEDGAWLFLH